MNQPWGRFSENNLNVIFSILITFNLATKTVHIKSLVISGHLLSCSQLQRLPVNCIWTRSNVYIFHFSVLPWQQVFAVLLEPWDINCGLPSTVLYFTLLNNTERAILSELNLTVFHCAEQRIGVNGSIQQNWIFFFFRSLL